MSPNVSHQKLARRMEFELIRFVEENKLGEVFDAPLDVFLSANETVQPDIFFVSQTNRKIIRDRIHGAPDLIIEILTDLSEYHELGQKRKLYEKAGVKELWVVDSMEKTIEVFVLSGKAYKTFAKVQHSGPIRSMLLPKFGVIVENIL